MAHGTQGFQDEVATSPDGRADQDRRSNYTSSSLRGTSTRPWLDNIQKTLQNELFLAADYASIFLAPRALWAPALRSYAGMVCADSRGAGVYWCPQKIAFYNAKFAVLCEGAHPPLTGHGFADAFTELAGPTQHLFDQALSTGLPVDVDKMLVFVKRNGCLEETYSALAAGMDDVLSKPVTFAEVLEKITAVMSKTHPSPEA